MSRSQRSRSRYRKYASYGHRVVRTSFHGTQYQGIANTIVQLFSSSASVLITAMRIAKNMGERYENTDGAHIARRLPPDVELGTGWDACIASLGRPAAQEGIKALMARGFHKPGDVENRLGYYLGQIAR